MRQNDAAASRGPGDARAFLPKLDGLDAARRRDATIERFRAAVAARLSDPPPIPALCAELGVAQRTLRTWCRESFGVSPKRYIRIQRMTRARDALRAAVPEETSVTRIASALGFGNLGLFAVEYRALFGESPSMTLRGPQMKEGEGALPRSTPHSGLALGTQPFRGGQ